MIGIKCYHRRHAYGHIKRHLKGHTNWDIIRHRVRYGKCNEGALMVKGRAKIKIFNKNARGIAKKKFIPTIILRKAGDMKQFID